MEKKKMLCIALPFALLFAGACNMIGLTDISPEEKKVKSKIASWTREWESENQNVYVLSKSVLEDIRKLPEASKRTYYFDKFVDAVLSSSFEVGPKFPLEHWTTRPLIMGADCEEDEPRRILLWRHRVIVDIGDMLYHETRRYGWKLADQIALVFRFAAKMEKERKRLGGLEVGNSGSLVDSLEVMVWYFLKGPPSAENSRSGRCLKRLRDVPSETMKRFWRIVWSLTKRKTRRLTKWSRNLSDHRWKRRSQENDFARWSERRESFRRLRRQFESGGKRTMIVSPIMLAAALATLSPANVRGINFVFVGITTDSAAMDVL